MSQQQHSKFKRELYKIIFEAETPSGKVFDIVLLVLILASVLTVSLESVTVLRENFADIFFGIEWGFTIVFTIEYFLRIYSSPKPLKYMLSFFGVVDLISIIPTYMAAFVLGSQYFIVIRVLRLLRIARIFKLTQFINEGQVLTKALRASMVKILVFLGSVLTIVVIIGAVMYLVEGAESGFTSIPISIYWTIVTLTTVGYGDIAPITTLGQMIASVVMILGYGIIAVPTGIVSVELARSDRETAHTRVCPNCHKEGHPVQANYCFNCGYPMGVVKAEQ